MFLVLLPYYCVLTYILGGKVGSLYFMQAFYTYLIGAEITMINDWWVACYFFSDLETLLIISGVASLLLCFNLYISSHLEILLIAPGVIIDRNNRRGCTKRFAYHLR